MWKTMEMYEWAEAKVQYDRDIFCLHSVKVGLQLIIKI